MSKNQFKSIALDQLINSVTEDIDDLTNDITKYDANDVVAPTNPNITNLVDKQSAGTTVDFERVYAQLERLIENGNTALTTINSFDIDVLSTDTINSTTSLINAIKNCMSEFTKIHLNHVKFIQKLKLIEIEQKHKL